MALYAGKRPASLEDARKRRPRPGYSGVRLIDPHALREEKGITYHPNHLRVLWKRGEFPAPFQLSPRRIAWLEEEIDAWIVAKAKQSKSA
jgi:hypothetical protein